MSISSNDVTTISSNMINKVDGFLKKIKVAGFYKKNQIWRFFLKKNQIELACVVSVITPSLQSRKISFHVLVAPVNTHSNKNTRFYVSVCVLD